MKTMTRKEVWEKYPRVICVTNGSLRHFLCFQKPIAVIKNWATNYVYDFGNGTVLITCNSLRGKINPPKSFLAKYESEMINLLNYCHAYEKYSGEIVVPNSKRTVRAMKKYNDLVDDFLFACTGIRNNH